ncbi:MAG: transglycosylase SLT domain-containing protein [Deltaproteobacteria bacterium]|nr:transglycosylase SLT domain-containing protein [Deltaproteobacteria bacterium]
MCSGLSYSRLMASIVVISVLMFLLPSLTFPGQKNANPMLDDFPIPKSISLCGESMPLENRHVLEMMDREFTISVWDRAQVFMWIKRAGRYLPYIEKKLAEEGMPEDLKYLAIAESSLITHIRSRKGAVGTWQFMAHTARKNGLRKDRLMDERLDFERSTEAALRYLKRLKEMFGTWTLAMAAYNCGEGRMRKEIKRQGIRDYYRLRLPMETERFIFRIAAVKIVMENPKRYGYSLTPTRIYKPIRCDKVQVKVRIPLSITDVARNLGTDFKVFKEFNPRIRGYYLPTGRYTIKVPYGLGPRLVTVLKQLDRAAARPMKKVGDGYYIVQPGDTLSLIAKRTGVSVAKLKKLNRISGSLIRIGQKIRLKP